MLLGLAKAIRKIQNPILHGLKGMKIIIITKRGFYNEH